VSDHVTVGSGQDGTQLCVDVRHAGQLLALHQADENPGRKRRGRATGKATGTNALSAAKRYLKTARLDEDPIGEVTRSKCVWFRFN